jgi:hypothetical protein
MSAGDAPGSTAEQRALRTSLWVGISFAVVSAVWGLILLGALGHAILEAVRVILAGGSDVAGISLVAYGVFRG